MRMIVPSPSPQGHCNLGTKHQRQGIQCYCQIYVVINWLQKFYKIYVLCLLSLY